MFQRILFAVGDDAASEAAVPVVSSYARRLVADIHLLHVHIVGKDRGNDGLWRMLQRVRTAPMVCVPPRRLLVAVDGSPASDLAVQESSGVAGELHARLIALHVRPIVTTLSGAFVEPEEDAQTIVDRAVAAARALDVEAEGRIVVTQSDAAETITSISEWEDVDLVVIGSRRPSELGGLLLGSVAHEVIHKLSRSVLLAARARATGSFSCAGTTHPRTA